MGTRHDQVPPQLSCSAVVTHQARKGLKKKKTPSLSLPPCLLHLAAQKKISSGYHQERSLVAARIATMPRATPPPVVSLLRFAPMKQTEFTGVHVGSSCVVFKMVLTSPCAGPPFFPFLSFFLKAATRKKQREHGNKERRTEGK